MSVRPRRLCHVREAWLPGALAPVEDVRGSYERPCGRSPW